MTNITKLDILPEIERGASPLSMAVRLKKPIYKCLVSLEQGASHSIKSQALNFLPKDESSSTIKYEATLNPNPERQTIKHMLIGGSKAVMGTIQVLHQLGYAQVGDWSPLLPSPTNPGEVMSVLVRQIVVQ